MWFIVATVAAVAVVAVAVDVAVAVAVVAVVRYPWHSLCFLGSTREVSVIFEMRFPFPR